MKLKKALILYLAIFVLSSCSYVIPCFVLNETGDQISVIYDESTYTIKSSDTKKIRGLYYQTFKVKYSDGTTQTYTENDLAFLENWQEYRDKYICNTFWGSKININFNESRQLVLLPCNTKYEPKVIQSKNE